MTFAQLASRIEKFAINNSPLILTAIGVTGTITTAVLTGKASYKAAEIISAEEHYRQDSWEHPEPATFKEKVKTCWPLYIPPLGTAALTISAIILANRIGTRRAAAMAAAYAISETAFEEYRDKVVEKLGKNKEREARDEIAQQRVDNAPVGKTEVIITGGGDCLFFDVFTGRYFRSDMETVKQAMNNLNYKIINHNYASLNDFYDMIGLAHIQIGEDIGWNTDDLMEILFSTTISDNQQPCITIDFHVKPMHNYFRAH